jgi:hypothetical protein
MFGNIEHNLLGIRRVGKAKIVKIFEKLSKREGSVRKRLMASGGAYPTHREFVKKIRGFSEESLAKALKTLAFLAQTKVYLFWKSQKENNNLTLKQTNRDPTSEFLQLQKCSTTVFQKKH